MNSPSSNTSPPPKSPRDIKRFILTREEAFQRENTDVLTRCFSKKPLAGHLGSLTLRLKLRKHIRVSDGKSAQIALVDVISGRLPDNATSVVAKLYDPLCWGHYQDDVGPFIYIDKEIAAETAAYRYLQNRGEISTNTSILKFYGSYSTAISHPDGRRRTVRLILMEHVDAPAMDSLDPKSLSQLVRKAIMEQIITMESRLYEIEVNHLNASPRNVMIEGLGGWSISSWSILDMQKSVDLRIRKNFLRANTSGEHTLARFLDELRMATESP
ncbi:hypothetical protein ASPCADRAFT_131729 [Aspergillus carbonarius ITEM 5010]|uniref:Protein kinase domain-containing protein n=1 Tax=Aspergillus carbonarius (strain ITEM 5010) TaxID=602072 RepID=A0A1R3RI52_ASPC5|nr:hypothetical protein ASPCADRAFT_131662 [Aspergillus carbonarius ITEM 5010]OOF94167.1 hypothetical protein ASPCADRAFT_131729 [Aspergillus carbonarius ITEM 5010]